MKPCCLWFYTYERELQKPDYKECQKSFRVDGRADAECIWEIHPMTAKQAPKHYGENLSPIVCLDTIPDDAYNGTDEDEKVRPVHSHARPTEDGAADKC